MIERTKSKRSMFVLASLAIVLVCAAAFSGILAFGKNETDVPEGYAQTVVYENVQMRYIEGEVYAYITNARSNNTAKKIVSCDRGMLAFDKDGNPLELDWWARDNELNYHYLEVHSGLTREILPGHKDEQKKGWKLNALLDSQVAKAAYVLFCDKEIAFEDGTVWINPDYDIWAAAYEGKKTDVSVLENYYPYEEKIE